jgi:hypothetical protein
MVDAFYHGEYEYDADDVTETASLFHAKVSSA